MRIVTRPDFDGITCAVLLYEALDITEPTLWVEPNDVQKGRIDIQGQDIIANLPYDKRCALWFDHHFTNQIDTPFDVLSEDRKERVDCLEQTLVGRSLKIVLSLLLLHDRSRQARQEPGPPDLVSPWRSVTSSRPESLAIDREAFAP